MASDTVVRFDPKSLTQIIALGIGLGGGVFGVHWHQTQIEELTLQLEVSRKEQEARCGQLLQLCRDDCYKYVERMERWHQYHVDRYEGNRDGDH